MSQVFINDALTYICQGADEIISLHQQLAELKASSQAVLQTQSEAWQREVAESQARFEQLEKQLWYEQNISFRNQLNATQRRLEESQACEAKLREVLEAVHAVSLQSRGIDGWHLNGEIATWDELLPEVAEALTIPSDNTTLSEMVTRAGEVMRERCAADVETNSLDFTRAEHTNSIRALPGVTLEDLK